MIKFFRKIRQNSLSQGKTGKYLKYAIGEIILVVIGILIALQINGWQQEKQNIRLEKRYLKDIINDLKKDSVNIHNLFLEASLVAAAKDSIYKILNNPDYQLDSLTIYFERQWNPYKVFSPSKSTIDEMKSSSHLEIIRDDDLRKEIVGIYYQYDLFLQDEYLYRESTREMLNVTKAGLRDIQNANSDEIKLLLKDQNVANRIRVNFAKGRLRSIINISEKCNRLMESLKKYQL